MTFKNLLQKAAVVATTAGSYAASHSFANHKNFHSIFLNPKSNGVVMAPKQNENEAVPNPSMPFPK